MVMPSFREIYIDLVGMMVQMYRQTDRQTDRQTNRRTGRQSDKHFLSCILVKNLLYWQFSAHLWWAVVTKMSALKTCHRLIKQK